MFKNKKIIIIISFIFIFFSFLIIDNGVSLHASTVEEEQLDDGVIYKHQIINSGYKNNAKEDRNVFTYTIPKDSKNVKLTTWTYSDPYGYSLQNLMTIAKDYEKHHPGWTVIGGINAEGFVASKDTYSKNEPTNAIVQDGDVIRKDVSSEETKELIALYDNRDYVIKRVPEVSDNPFLYIYSEGFDSEVLKHLEVKAVNRLPLDGEIAILTPSCGQISDLTGYNVFEGSSSMYRVTTSFPASTLTGSNYGIFVKGEIDGISNVNAISSISRGKFYLVTKGDLLINELSEGIKIKCQYDYLDEFGQVNTVVGYWFKYIDNGVICDENYKVYLEEENRYSTTYGSHDYWKYPTKQRAGIGFKENGDVVIMAAHTGAKGPAQYEVGEYFYSMGCVNAFQFDGGGSVTFIKRNAKGDFDMLNTPADGNPRSLACGLLIVVKRPQINILTKEVSSSSLTINSEIVEANGYELDNLYVKFEGTNSGSLNDYYPLEGNDVTIKGLYPNNEYTYSLYIKENDKYKSLNLTGSIFTSKSAPSVSKIKISKNKKGYYEINVVVKDQHSAIKKVYISIDDGGYNMVPTNLIYPYVGEGDYFNNLQVKIVYDLNDLKESITEEYKDIKIDFDLVVFMDLYTRSLDKDYKKILFDE